MAYPDDRSDNVEKLQDMIQNTIQNIHKAEETLAIGDMPEYQRERIEAKNERRRESIAGMREEVRDEARNAQNR
ncbi:small acid-soluble spore protein Tlp [Aneurinibacillus sp. Ricciae_BoGa-3]|uniref:small acid-soluble spore protein Tlp n=1 Tax=Aneurinibacillus sp. Ricciae_BoGa-3 TaxID=3022697 RepID=UPI002340BBB7|nr:small acid-soluble spore protein Tlp [Aneurinibacillus sp. Ricciae_BoGa-3]WCK55871.1 small acid-soluble spore protein Tlp [Aneurinibacillus sp. Ricciae_BoGa-3]